MKLLQASLLFFHFFKEADNIIYVPVDSQIVTRDALCILISSCVLFITKESLLLPTVKFIVTSKLGNLSKISRNHSELHIYELLI